MEPVNAQIQSMKADIVNLATRESAFINQYESASGDLKINLLKLVITIREQIVQLERQKTILMERTPSPSDSRPITPATSPYDEAPSPPHPTSSSIDKWMFYTIDSAGKSTVVSVHQRYFVTFRHGTHMLLQVGNVMKIFHAESEPNEEIGHDVTVVDINEELDFILLCSKETIVQTAPVLVAAEKSDSFLLAGFGDQSTGSQQLAYLNGIIHSVRGYYFSLNNRPDAPLMGPFYLGIGQSSRGDSGGACWSARGLIGINFGVTSMPDYGFTPIAISEAATFSPKNIISPVVPYIERSLMAQLRIEEQTSPKFPSAKKRKPLQTEVEGLGAGKLMTSLDEL